MVATDNYWWQRVYVVIYMIIKWRVFVLVLLRTLLNGDNAISSCTSNMHWHALHGPPHGPFARQLMCHKGLSKCLFVWSSKVNSTRLCSDMQSYWLIRIMIGASCHVMWSHQVWSLLFNLFVLILCLLSCVSIRRSVCDVMLCGNIIMRVALVNFVFRC